MKKRRLVVLLALMMVISTTQVTFAAGVMTEDIEKDIIIIEDNDISISKAENKEYYNYCQEIVAAIESNDGDISGISREIRKVSRENEEIVETLTERMSRVIADGMDADKNTDTTVVFSEEAAEDYERTINIDGDTTVTINPLGIIVSMPVDYITAEDRIRLIRDDIVATYVPSSYASSKSKSAEHGIIGYNLFGKKLWGVFVECDFYYNGKKAWYKANYDGYAKRFISGFLWSHYNEKPIKEKDGSDYHAGYACNVCWGIQVKGQGLVFQEKRCKVNIYCNKNGTITKTDSVD